MTPGKKKIVIYSLCAAAAVLAALGLTALLLGGTASYDGELEAEVKGPVEIRRDADGVPFISASSWEDAYCAMGYLHAQDRLALMEHLRAAANGRLSKLIGPDAVLMDRISLVMGFARRASSVRSRLGEPYAGYMASYVKGVNLFKKEKYWNVLGLTSVPADGWAVEDVLAIMYMSEWAQSYLCNLELLFAFPDELRRYPLKDIIPNEMIYWYSDAEQKNVFALREIQKAVKRYTGMPCSGFAVHLTVSYGMDGRDRSFFNLDASTRLYPGWYPVCVKVKDVRVDGVTYSGNPFITVGRNNSIAFAGFTQKVDTQDFYRESTRAVGDAEWYLDGGQWKDFERADGARATVRGPIISDVFKGLYRTDVISVASVFPDETYVAALFDLPVSDSVAAAQRRLTNVQSAPRVYLLADRENALVLHSGKIPARNFPDTVIKTGMYAGMRGLVDISGYPGTRNAGAALVGDAIFEDAPPVLSRYIFFDDRDRHVRLRELVERGAGLDLSDIKMALFDTHSTVASKYVPLMSSLLEKFPITSARLCRIYFSDWDFQMRRDSVPATLFQAILAVMIRETVGDELKSDIEYVADNYYYFIDRYFEAFTDGKSLLFDDVTTRDKAEFREMIFDRAFLKAMRLLNNSNGPIMEEWMWGRMHTGRFAMPLVREDSLLAGWVYEDEAVPASGGFSTPYRGSFEERNGFAVKEATALSGVLEPDSMRICSSYGYSLNPFSDFYEGYRENRQFSNTRASEWIHRFSLVPAR